MSNSKKDKKDLPEVHILGDLNDVKNLVSGVNKKKTIVVFKDGEEGSFYLEVNGKIQKISDNDLAELQKEYRLIHFSFFPGLKKVEELTETKPEKQKAKIVEKADKIEKKGKSERKEHKEKTEKKDKKDKKDKKRKNDKMYKKEINGLTIKNEKGEKKNKKSDHDKE